MIEPLELTYCPDCNTGFEFPLPRCPICRKQRRLFRKTTKKAAKKLRKKVGKGTRRRVFNRDGWRCLACGTTDEERLTIDHVIPLSQGGTNDPDNFQTLCADCNNRVKRGKSTDYRVSREYSDACRGTRVHPTGVGQRDEPSNNPAGNLDRTDG